MDTNQGEFSKEHWADGKKWLMQCSQCGVFLSFKMTSRPGLALSFPQPHDCEAAEVHQS